jgi:ABC-type enterobactin transport system permease subunit
MRTFFVKLDILNYRWLNRNAVLRCGAVLMLLSGAVQHFYSLPIGDPWQLKVAKLAVYIGAALGISSSGIVPPSAKPNMAPDGTLERT